ncbi:MAG: hypothetical protein ACLPX5_01795 [Dissulfurispiraceae bacterium]
MKTKYIMDFKGNAWKMDVALTDGIGINYDFKITCNYDPNSLKVTGSFNHQFFALINFNEKLCYLEEMLIGKKFRGGKVGEWMLSEALKFIYKYDIRDVRGELIPAEEYDDIKKTPIYNILKKLDPVFGKDNCSFFLRKLDLIPAISEISELEFNNMICHKFA